MRNIESHFLSAQECIMAGHFQNLHPNPCRFSPGGFFGSKFATVCVTGMVACFSCESAHEFRPVFHFRTIFIFCR